MKNVYILITILLSLSLNSCKSRIKRNITKHYAPIDYKQDILIIGQTESMPENTEIIGLIKIGDTGFTAKCDYGTVINTARMEARKVGGNAIKIIEHKPPSMFGSSCHRITAQILRIKNISKYILQSKEAIPNLDYAILNIYRHSNGYGALVSYNLHLNDSVICRVKNKFKTSINIKKPGKYYLWAKTESKTEIPINIELGKIYYIKCGVGMGAFVGHPKLELIDNNIGKPEFESIKPKKQ